mgnify:CR=1 FL=1
MYNGGATKVKYQIDTSPLKLLREENFDQPILECLNPEGIIEPGYTGAVHWQFFPREAKTYMVRYFGNQSSDFFIRVYCRFKIYSVEKTC